jgi:2-oxoglutarate ferredoxin oxidoreductase subunit alpha
MVMFNDATAAGDIYRVRDGGVLLYDSTPLSPTLKRDGIQHIGFPETSSYQISSRFAAARKTTQYGLCRALASVRHRYVGHQSGSRGHLWQETGGHRIQPGLYRRRLSMQRARLQARISPDWNRFPAAKGKIITEGNTAAALGAIYGGASVICWYPITPSSSLAESMEYYLPRLRKQIDGKKTYAIVQAEDEIASAGMIVGAGWAGARSMTSTSGPGVSLMNESIGLAYMPRFPACFSSFSAAALPRDYRPVHNNQIFR